MESSLGRSLKNLAVLGVSFIYGAGEITYTLTGEERTVDRCV